MKHLLVIDEDPASRESFVSAFEDTDYEVVLVDSGEKGIETAQSTPCDLVFVDLALPDMNGAQTVRKLRELSETLPIFVMTTAQETSLHELDHVRKKGLPFHLVRKPIGQIEMQALVYSVLG